MNDLEFEQIFTIMEASFPPYELRTYEGQRALLRHPYYKLYTAKGENGRVIAFLAGWEFPAFRFVEHIAVDGQIRGGGIGKNLLMSFLELSEKPVLLEVEPPSGGFTERRIHFYERIGFHLNPFDYAQPPLREGHAELALNIMSFPRPLTEASFAPYKEALYREVYQVGRLKSEPSV